MADPTDPAADPAADEDADRRAAALVVAMELLRTAVADLPAALAATAVKFSAPAPAAAAGGVSAFDRPQAVIVVGPKPLPVSGGGGGGPGRPKPEPENPGVLMGLGNMLAAKFSAALSPLAIFGAVLSSNAAGFQILGQAVQLVAAVLAPVLLPIVFSVAAALIELSDDLAKDLGPAIQTWTRLILSTVLPVMSFLAKVIGSLVGVFATAADMLMSAVMPIAEAFGDAVTAVKNFVGWVMNLPVVKQVREGAEWVAGEAKDGAEWVADKARGAVDWVGEKADALNPFSKGEDKAGLSFVPGLMDRIGKAATGKPGEPGTAPTAPAEGGFLASVAALGKGGGKPATGGKPREAIDDVIESFRKSIMPKAQFTGLAQVGQQAQLAGLNGDPIQARILAAMMRAADGIEGVRADMRRDADPRIGTGS